MTMKDDAAVIEAIDNLALDGDHVAMLLSVATLLYTNIRDIFDTDGKELVMIARREYLDTMQDLEEYEMEAKLRDEYNF